MRAWQQSAISVVSIWLLITVLYGTWVSLLFTIGLWVGALAVFNVLRGKILGGDE